MPHEYRSQPYRQHGGRFGRERDAREYEQRRSRDEEWRRDPMRTGEDRDPYRTGDEQRYWSEWDRPSGRGFEGQRSYPTSGYREETGYRDRSNWKEPPQGASRARGPYAEFEQFGWRNEDAPGYYGTGAHYGGGYGTAPSTRTAEAGTLGAVGYGREGAWSDSDDWTPESGAVSGSFENFGRSPYGAQGAFGRETQSPYGDSTYRGPSYRGRGPKGYERSDERLKELICERLTDDPRIDASDVHVEVNQKIVRLTGTVAERRTKYEIEDLLERLSGVKDVDNQLRVQAQPLWSGADAGVASASTRSTEARSSESKPTIRK